MYSTDERYKAYNEICFDTQIKAYEEIARRLGLNYNAVQERPVLDKSDREYIESALEYWDFMHKRYGNTVDGKNAKKNYDLLLVATRKQVTVPSTLKVISNQGEPIQISQLLQNIRLLPTHRIEKSVLAAKGMGRMISQARYLKVDVKKNAPESVVGVDRVASVTSKAQSKGKIEPR